MGTFTRAKRKRQRRHVGARSADHQIDKKQGEQFSQTRFIPVASRSVRRKREFAHLGLASHEMKHVDGRWLRCREPDEFGEFLDAEAQTRGWFTDAVTRKGKKGKMRRRDKSAIHVLTCTFPPWLSDWLVSALEGGLNPGPELAAIRDRWITAAMNLLEGKRHVLGYAFHADTDDPHFDLCVSRNDGKGGRIGPQGLGLVGPWVVGVERQVRAGATISEEKMERLERDEINFARRYGVGAVPLDVSLARALDIAASEVIGPELDKFRKEYARTVPELEQEHRQCALQELDEARRKLLGAAPPERPLTL